MLHNHEQELNSNMLSLLYKSSIDALFVTDVVDASYSDNTFDLTQLRDALSTGQLASKLWILHEIEDCLPDNPHVLIVGGWIGTLSRLFLGHFEKYHSHERYSVTSLDVDPISTKMAQVVNTRFPVSFTTITKDMYDVTPEEYQNYDIVINTSCEHIEDVRKWSDGIPEGMVVIAQSNNFFKHPQHVNCVNSEKELEEQLNLRHVHYKGSKVLTGTYTRFMVIGLK
jgi:hypothetical protein